MTDPLGYLSAVLSDHQAQDSVEKQSLDEMVEAVNQLLSPFGREDPHHFTASAIIVHPSDSLVLLLKHRLFGFWIQPGGHIDEGEFPYAAALRESIEETGLTLEFFGDTPQLIHMDAHDTPTHHRHYDLTYLLIAKDETPHPAEGESQNVQWFTWEDAIALGDNHTSKAIVNARTLFGD